MTRAALLCKAVCRSSVLQGIKSSIQRRNRLDDRSYRRPIELMIALSVVHTAIEVTPFNTRTADIEQPDQRPYGIRRTRMLRRDTLDGRPQLGAFIVQLPRRAGPAQLDVDPAVRPPTQPRPQAVRQTLQRRPGLAQCLAFLVSRQRLLGQKNIVLRWRVAVDPQFVLSLMRRNL